MSITNTETVFSQRFSFPHLPWNWILFCAKKPQFPFTLPLKRLGCWLCIMRSNILIAWIRRISNELPRRKQRGIRAMSYIVTPAQAGVQKAPKDWIPAFAGMTKLQQAAGN